MIKLINWHISHPWTLPANSDPRFHLKELPAAYKIGSIALAILASPLLLIGGVVAFYGAAGYFKKRHVKEIKSKPAKPAFKLPNPAELSVVPPPAKRRRTEDSLPSGPKPPVPTLKPIKPPVDMANLSVKQIRNMTPDEQGALIDQYAKRTHKPSQLTKAQLLALVRSEAMGSVKIFNMQGLGKGHCGRYCINNALQRNAIDEEEFLDLTAEAFHQMTGMALDDAGLLVRNDDQFGIDAGILAHILQRKGIQTKNSPIVDLPGINGSKQTAMENYIGEAQYVLVGNIGDGVYDMPTEKGLYALAKGHFVALRKDSKGEWWYIDSRAPKPVNIALAVIPRSCTLIVPV